MNIVGIDPGVTGAIAIIYDDLARPPLCFDAPTITTKVGKKNRRSLDLPQLYRELHDMVALHGSFHLGIAIEDVHAMPQQGVVSMFTMGYGLCAYHMALTALKAPWETVTPQRWHAALGLPAKADKAQIRKVAERLFPTADLGTRQDQGRADALLIAEWRRRQG